MLEAVHIMWPGQELEQVREFGVYAKDLTALCQWIIDQGVTTVAMESTGDYWQNLYTELIAYGLEVILCNGKFTKNAKGKKTDVKDCRWIKNYIPWDCLRRISSQIWSQSNSALIVDRERTGLIWQLPLRTKCRNISNFLTLGLMWLRMYADSRGGNYRRYLQRGSLDPQSLAEHRHYNCENLKRK